MVTKITINLTDDERRAITGRRRPASRKEITEFVQRLVAYALHHEMAPPPVGSTTAIDPAALTCTSLDHLYPIGPKTPDTPCYCGRNKWGAFSPAIGGGQ